MSVTSIAPNQQKVNLIIEPSNPATNNRDKQTLLTHFENRGGVPFAYDWRSKSERLLSIADDINGARHDFYVYENPEWFKQLYESGVLTGDPKHAT